MVAAQVPSRLECAARSLRGSPPRPQVESDGGSANGHRSFLQNGLGRPRGDSAVMAPAP